MKQRTVRKKPNKSPDQAYYPDKGNISVSEAIRILNKKNKPEG